MQLKNFFQSVKGGYFWIRIREIKPKTAQSRGYTHEIAVSSPLSLYLNTVVVNRGKRRSLRQFSTHKEHFDHIIIWAKEIFGYKRARAKRKILLYGKFSIIVILFF